MCKVLAIYVTYKGLPFQKGKGFLAASTYFVVRRAESYEFLVVPISIFFSNFILVLKIVHVFSAMVIAFVVTKFTSFKALKSTLSKDT